MDGKFIVFEGGHGSGKTTLALSLSNYLTRQGRKVILTKEPFRQDIRRIIEKLSADNVESNKDLSILYLLAADRYLHTRYIQRELKNNDFIISDRYVLSSFVYQQMQNISLKKIMEANSFCLIPDLTLFIDVSYEKRGRRSEDRNKPESFFRKRYQQEDILYRRICKEFSKKYNILQINGSNPLTNVLEDIIRRVSEKFL